MNFYSQYFLLLVSIQAIYVPHGNLPGPYNTSASLDTDATIYSTFAAPPPHSSYTISTPCTSSIIQTIAAPIVTTPCTSTLASDVVIVTKYNPAPSYATIPAYTTTYTTTAAPEVSVYSTIAYYSAPQETLREIIYESRDVSINTPPYSVPTTAAPEASTYPDSGYYAAPEVTTNVVPTYTAPQPFIQEEYAPEVEAPQVPTYAAPKSYTQEEYTPEVVTPQVPTYAAPKSYNQEEYAPQVVTPQVPTYVAPQVPTYVAPKSYTQEEYAPQVEAPQVPTYVTPQVPTYVAPKSYTQEEYAPQVVAPKVPTYAAPKSEYAPEVESYEQHQPSVPTEAAPIATPDCTEAAPIATQTPSGYLSNPETIEEQSSAFGGLYGDSVTTASPSEETSSPEYLPPATAEYSIGSFAFTASGTNGLGFIMITVLLLI